MTLHERALSGLHSALISRIAHVSRDARVLDTGCGTGAWLERLAEAGFRHLHGIDRDLSEFGCGRATASHGNLDDVDLGLEARKFDLITAIEVLEHLENPGRLFAHLQRHLAENGTVLLTTPNVQSLQCRLRFALTGKLQQFDEKADPTHLLPWPMISLERMFKRYGFQADAIWTFPERCGSTCSRPAIRRLARLLSFALPNDLAGDILCVLVRRA